MFIRLDKTKKLILIIILGLFLVYPNFFVNADSININVTVTICGNNIQEGDEICDGSDLAGQACNTRGFDSGILTCNTNCAGFNISQCETDDSGGGGGGGTPVPPPPVETKVIFSGRAYPSSEVFILKDAQIVATTIAGSNANFNTSLTGLSGGNYVFSIYTEDMEGRRSSLFSFSIYVNEGVQTSVSSIFVAPSIDIDKSQVKRGDNIAIFGQTTPDSEVTIVVNSDTPHFSTIDSDEDGIYLYNFNTAVLEMGDHTTKSKTAFNGDTSNYGQVMSFAVGDTNIFKEDDAPSPCESSDVNRDGRVDLIDFSILAYWYKKASPPEHVDLKVDGIVNIVDFSIMAYCWTG